MAFYTLNRILDIGTLKYPIFSKGRVYNTYK
nr:MAG TPA: hypothetical protein [Caudoviricetes sp.]